MRLSGRYTPPPSEGLWPPREERRRPRVYLCTDASEADLSSLRRLARPAPPFAHGLGVTSSRHTAIRRYLRRDAPQARGGDAYLSLAPLRFRHRRRGQPRPGRHHLRRRTRHPHRHPGCARATPDPCQRQPPSGRPCQRGLRCVSSRGRDDLRVGSMPSSARQPVSFRS